MQPKYLIYWSCTDKITLKRMVLFYPAVPFLVPAQSGKDLF